MKDISHKYQKGFSGLAESRASREIKRHIYRPWALSGAPEGVDIDALNYLRCAVHPTNILEVFTRFNSFAKQYRLKEAA